MFNGHLDVMPAGNEPGWTDDPWSGKIADGKVWGRGSANMKAGVTGEPSGPETISFASKEYIQFTVTSQWKNDILLIPSSSLLPRLHGGVGV